LDVLSVFYDAWNYEVSPRKLEHLLLPRLVILRIVLGKRNSGGVVVVTRLLAIRASGFYIDHQRHTVLPPLPARRSPKLKFYQMRLQRKNRIPAPRADVAGINPIRAFIKFIVENRKRLQAAAEIH